VLVDIPIIIRVLIRSEEDMIPLPADDEEHLGQHDDLVSREVKLLDRLAEDNLGLSIRVDVGGIESVNALLITPFANKLDS
jgi:hypothetical protein